MSDSYLQFSCALALKTDEEIAWWRRHTDLDMERVYVREGFDADTPSPKTFQHVECERLYRAIMDSGTDSERYDFEVSFEYDKDGNHSIWFHADEWGEAWQVAQLAHHFFCDLRPTGDDEFIITWAITCSRPQLDAFEGGTAVATKDGVAFCGQEQQYGCCIEELKRKKGGGG